MVRDRLGLRGRIMGATVLLVVAIDIITGVFLETDLRRQLQQRIESDLREAAVVGELVLQRSEAPSSRETADEVADTLAPVVDARVTILSRDGTVIGDSSLNGPALDRVENHADRPEVGKALADREGSATRYSTTLGTEMLYLARRYELPGNAGVVVLRVSRPLSEIDDEVRDLRFALLYAGMMSLLVAAFAGGLLSYLANKRLQPILSAAKLRVGRSEPAPAAATSPAPGETLGGITTSFLKISEELEFTMGNLADERDRFQIVLDSMQEAVLAIDQHGDMILVNPAARELLSIEGPVEGRPLKGAISNYDVLALAEPGRDTVTSTEFVLHAPTGQAPGPSTSDTRTVLARATPQADGGVMIVMHDVTDIRRLETVRRDFVANVSHELRTPVSIIRANAETLLAIDNAFQGPERKFLEALLRNADRLGGLIGDLLDISRIEVGKYVITSEPIKLASIARRAIESVEVKASEKRMTLVCEIDEELAALADPKALDQVMLNLTMNAVKYTSEGGHLAIVATCREEDVLVEFVDDGPGIDPIHRPRIFERFYRVDPGRSREMGGTGLGLSIVKHLMQAMQGNVGVVPNEPQGSRFWITLPRVPVR